MAEQFIVELESRLKTDNVEKEIKNLNLRLKKTDKIVINVDGKKAIKEIQTLEDEVGRLYKRVKKPDGEDGFSKITESIKNTNTEILKFVNQFDGSMNTITTTTNSAGNKIRTEVKEISDAFGTITKTTQQYQEINGAFQKMGEAITVVTQDMVKYEKQAQKQLEIDKLVAKEKEKLIEKEKQLSQAEKEKMANVTKTTSQTEAIVNGTKALVTTMTEENSLGKRVTTTITEYTDSMGRAVKETQKFDEQGKQLSGTLKEISQSAKITSQSFTDIVGKVAKFYVATLPIQAFQTAITETIDIIKEFNGATTDLRKVSDLEGESLAEYTSELADLGTEVGRTKTEMTQLAAVAKQAGYSDEDAKTLTKVASIYSNVADSQIDASESMTFVVSQLKSFGIEAENAIQVVDKLNEVSNTESVSNTDLANALTKSSSALSALGNDMDETIGLITAGTTVMTHQSQKVGKGLQTIGINIQTIAKSAGELTYSVNGATKSISLFDKAGNQLNTFDALKLIAQDWDEMNASEQTALANLLGGKTRFDVATAVLDQFDTALRATETSINSAGSAEEENAKYLESLEGATSKLRAEFEKLVLGDGGLEDFAIKLVEVGTAILKFANSDIGQGIIQTALWSTGLSLLVKGFTALKNSNIVSAISGIIQALASGEKATIAFGTALKTLNINPVMLGITALTTAVFGLKGIYDILNVTLEEHIDNLKNAKQEYDDAQSSVESTEGKLEEVETKIKEINDLGGAKVSRKGELLELESQKEELKTILELEKERADQAAKVAEEEARAILDKEVASPYSEIPKYTAMSEAIKDATVAMGYYNEEIQGLANNQLDLDEKFEEGTITLEEHKKGTEEINQTYEEYKENLREGYDYLSYYTDALLDVVNSTEEGSEAHEETLKLIERLNKARRESSVYLGEEGRDLLYSVELTKRKTDALNEQEKSLEENTKAQNDNNDANEEGNKEIDEATKKLAILNKNLTSLAKNLSSKKLDMSKAIDVTVFDSMDDALKSNKKEWQKYIEVLGDSTSTYAEIQKATNKLAQAYLESDDFLENLDESTKDYYTSQLELMGVENSKIVVEEILASKMSMLSAEQEYAEQTGRDLKDATYEEIDAFIQESQYSDLSKQALYELALQKASVNDVVLDFSGDLQNLITYVEGIGGATKALSLLQKVKSGKIPSAASIDENDLIKSAQKEVEDALNQINSIQIGTSQVDSNKNSSSSSRNGGSNKTDGKRTSSSTAKEEDKWKKEYDKKKELLDHYLEIEKITEKKYYELRKKLEDTYLTNSKENRKKYQETILQNEEDFYAYDKKIYEKEYENKLSKLESNHERGKISDKKYYDNLEKLRDKYLKTSVYHEEEQSSLDKQYEKDIKSLEKSLEKKKISNKQYIKELNALNEEYNKNTSDLVKKYSVKDYNLQKENADKIRDITNEIEDYRKNKSLNTFEKRREQLDKQLEDGEISEKKYWKKIQKLEEKFLTNSKKHRKDYADYIKELNKEIVQGFINDNLNTFNDKVAKIEYNLNMDYITEEEYYSKLEKLELKYLTDSVEHRKAYASEIKEIEQKLYNYLKKKKEEKIKELETAISELDKAHEQAINDLQKELDNSIKNRRTELVNQKKEEIDAQKKLKDLSKESYNEQINLQKELKEASDDYYKNLIKEKEEAKKLSKEEYDNAISEQKKLKESSKNYYNSILDEMEKEREESEKNLTLLEKQEALAKAKQSKQIVLKDGKFQYSQDQDAISKAEEDLKETIETQRYEERKKQIEDLRDSEEKGFEDTIEQLENERDEIQDGFEKEIDELENQKEITEEGFESVISGIEKERDLIQEEYEKAIEALENERDTIQNASNLALSKMDETTNSLINHYNARMNEINELYHAQKDVLDNQLAQAKALEIKRDSNWSNMQSTVSSILNKLDNLKNNVSESEYKALTTERSWYNDGYFLASGGTTDYSNSKPVVISSGSSSSSSNYSYDKSPSGSSSSSSSQSQNTTPSNFVSNVTVNVDSSKSKSSSTSTASNVAKKVATGIISTIFGKHASGIDKIKEDELALVGDSPNKELVIGSKLNGNLMSLQKGTGVVNAKSTKSLAGLLNSGFKESNLISSNSTNSNSTNITIGNIELPQVKNGKDLVDYLQNFSIDMTKKAYSH